MGWAKSAVGDTFQSVSDPVRASTAPPERKLHRRHPDDEAELAKEGSERVVELDAEQAEAYLCWLETGEGPDPCQGAFSE